MAFSVQCGQFPTFKHAFEQPKQDPCVQRGSPTGSSFQSLRKLGSKTTCRLALPSTFTASSATGGRFDCSSLFGDSGKNNLLMDLTDGPVKCKPSRRRHSQWKMELADPVESFRDSFGNDCPAVRRAREELQTVESYKKLNVAMSDMHNQMQEMVAKELYEEAAEVRDTLNMLEFRKRLLELSAKPRVLYRVGDVVVHRRYGYRGVVYGHDIECSAPKDWQDTMKVDALPDGREQPFYHVLVDSRDRPGGVSTYVAQENLALHKLGRSVLHSWIPKFFVGFQDGEYLPKPMLRRLYPNDW